MRELYEKLYEDCFEMENFLEHSHFVSMVGKEYFESPLKFMLVGRAPNGWEALDTTNKEKFAVEANKQFLNKDRWNWITSENGVLYLSSQVQEKVDYKNRYCVSSKPYWSYSCAIWNQLAKIQKVNSNNDVWQNNIVWSNLYKISPKEGLNPNSNSMKKQQKTCIEILKKELECFKPTHVLIMSGLDWFEPFSKLFTNVQCIKKMDGLSKREKRCVYVEGIARYNNSKVVIASRPEYRNKNKYVSDIIDTFLNKL